MSLRYFAVDVHADFCMHERAYTLFMDHPEGMDRADFFIGLEFWTATGKWRCTDVGSRTIAAIKLDKADPSWYHGPPYAVAEYVFDEYDFGGCSRTP